MHHTDFRPAAVRYGDKTVRGFVTICGKCGFVGEVRCNTFAGKGKDGHIVAAFVARKLVEKGWHIGSRIADDRCPRCVLDQKHREARVSSKVVKLPAMEGPAEPKPEDRRIICAKLDDVYDTNAGRYHAMWTDAKVASDLGIPRAWVEDVRKLLYGPEGGNAEIEAAASEARVILRDVKPLLEKAENAKAAVGSLMSEVSKLANKADMIEQKLHRIERALKDG